MMRGPALALALFAAGLLMLVAGEWLAGEMRLAHIAAPAPPARLAGGPAAAAGETAAPEESITAWVATALARPLMSASRRPAAVAGGSGLALSNGLPRLAGTVFKADGPTAVFARDDSGHAVIVRQGGMLGAYRVTRIEPDRVTLTGPDGAAQTLHPTFGQGQEGVGPRGPYLPGPMNMPGALPGVMQPPQFQPPDQSDN
jgi:hypothetical protein